MYTLAVNYDKLSNIATGFLFGLLLCLVLVGVYEYLQIRKTVTASDEDDLVPEVINWKGVEIHTGPAYLDDDWGVLEETPYVNQFLVRAGSLPNSQEGALLCLSLGAKTEFSDDPVLLNKHGFCMTRKGLKSLHALLEYYLSDTQKGQVHTEKSEA